MKLRTPTTKKFEIPFLMVLLILLGSWLVWTGKRDLYNHSIADNARVVEFRIANTRGVLEIIPREPAAGETLPTDPHHPDRFLFRLHLRGGFVSEQMTASDFRLAYGQKALEETVQAGDNFLFRLLNITSWTNLIWASLGLIGQIAFFGRMLVQWIASEKKEKSVVPASFWWMSLWGGVLLFTYFVWRQDFVGVLGQSTGVVIYARNLRLIAKERRRKAEAARSVAP